MWQAPRRFPRRVYGEGAEPDARYSLANERTFLAWIHTAIALVAGGVAIEALGLGISPAFRVPAAIVLMVAGILSAVQAWLGWMRTERALRRGEPLPSATLALPIGVAVILVGALMLTDVLIR